VYLKVGAGYILGTLILLPLTINEVDFIANANQVLLTSGDFVLSHRFGNLQKKWERNATFNHELHEVGGDEEVICYVMEDCSHMM